MPPRLHIWSMTQFLRAVPVADSRVQARAECCQEAPFDLANNCVGYERKFAGTGAQQWQQRYGTCGPASMLRYHRALQCALHQTHCYTKHEDTACRTRPHHRRPVRPGGDGARHLLQRGPRRPFLVRTAVIVCRRLSSDQSAALDVLETRAAE